MTEKRPAALFLTVPDCLTHMKMLAGLAVIFQECFDVTMYCDVVSVDLLLSCGIQRVLKYGDCDVSQAQLSAAVGCAEKDKFPSPLRWAGYSKLFFSALLNSFSKDSYDLIVYDHHFMLGKLLSEATGVIGLSVSTQVPNDNDRMAERWKLLFDNLLEEIYNQTNVKLVARDDNAYWSRQKNLVLAPRYWAQDIVRSEYLQPSFAYWGPVKGPAAFDAVSPTMDLIRSDADAALRDKIANHLKTITDGKLCIVSFGTVVSSKLIPIFSHHFCQLYQYIVDYAVKHENIIFLVAVHDSAKAVIDSETDEAWLETGMFCSQKHQQLKIKLPSNVYVKKWLQMRLFIDLASAAIFHGGVNTFVEMTSKRIPVIVTPFREDQFTMAKIVSKHAVGKSLYFANNSDRKSATDLDLTSTTLSDSLDDILLHNVSKYRENIDKLYLATSDFVASKDSSKCDKLRNWVFS